MKRHQRLDMAFKIVLEEDSENIWIHTDGYAEPGYGKEQIIAKANWNNVSKEIQEKLEKLKIPLEWSDEWDECESCQRLVRTQPDSYGWKKYYFVSEHGLCYCGDCVKQDTSCYEKYLRNNPARADTLGIDWTTLGYILLDEKYENGWHPGQNDDPKEIAKVLREKGISNFIFKIKDVGQFDINFSIWVKSEEIGN